MYFGFAAAETYHEPGSSGCYGPKVFTSGWYCEDEIPEGRLRKGG